MVTTRGGGPVGSGGRARHGKRRRCSDPHDEGCQKFARRNSVPAVCESCGGGTRAEAKHLPDGTRVARGQVSVPPRVQALLDGSIGVEDLDDEELIRGFLRARDGTFKGGQPKVIPKVVHDRVIREIFKRADDMLRGSLLDAVGAILKIATDERVSPADRLKAATWVYERLRGKVPDQVHVSVETGFEQLLEEVHRTDPPPEPQVIEGEVLDPRL